MIKTFKVITNVSASCRVFKVQFVSIIFVYNFAITVPTDRSFVNFISGYLSTGLSNMGVSFDYQQGFSAIFVSIPCFLPRDKVHDFFKSCGLYTSSQFHKRKKKCPHKIAAKKSWTAHLTFKSSDQPPSFFHFYFSAYSVYTFR